MSGCELYRHYAKDGTLLYIGVSLSAINRLSQHRYASKWFKSISTVTIEHFETREECEVAEVIAINTEKPLFNVVTKRGGVKKTKDDQMNAHDVAAVLGIDRKTLRKWVRTGVCPVAPLAGIEPPLWHRAAVEAFVRGQ